MYGSALYITYLLKTNRFAFRTYVRYDDLEKIQLLVSNLASEKKLNKKN